MARVLLLLVAAVGGVAAGFLLTPGSAKAQQAGAFVNYDWTVTPPSGYVACGTSANNLPADKDLGDAWTAALGPYYQTVKHYNQMDARWFADPAKESWGQDGWFVDFPKAALVGSHGNGNVDSNYFGLLMEFDGGHGCNSMNWDWLLGNTGRPAGLYFLHMYACESSNVGPQLTNWYGWASKAAGIHLAGGFHGNSYSVAWTNRITDYVQEGLTTSIAMGWMDHLTIFRASGNYWDQCAVPWVIGTNSDDAWNRWNELYTETRADPVPAGYLGYWYICNCCAQDGLNGPRRCTPSC
jgi:hypothetical protein